MGDFGLCGECFLLFAYLGTFGEISGFHVSIVALQTLQTKYLGCLTPYEDALISQVLVRSKALPGPKLMIFSGFGPN